MRHFTTFFITSFLQKMGRNNTPPYYTIERYHFLYFAFPLMLLSVHGLLERFTNLCILSSLGVVVCIWHCYSFFSSSLNVCQLRLKIIYSFHFGLNNGFSCLHLKTHIFNYCFLILILIIF